MMVFDTTGVPCSKTKTKAFGRALEPVFGLRDILKPQQLRQVRK